MLLLTFPQQLQLPDRLVYPNFTKELTDLSAQKTIKENLIFLNYYNNLQFVIPIILSINTIEFYLYVHSCKIKLYIENTHTRTYDDN